MVGVAVVSEAVGSGLAFPHCFSELFEHMAGTGEGRRALAQGGGLTVWTAPLYLSLSTSLSHSMPLCLALLLSVSFYLSICTYSHTNYHLYLCLLL